MSIGVCLFMLFGGLILWFGGMFCFDEFYMKAMCSVTGWIFMAIPILGWILGLA